MKKTLVLSNTWRPDKNEEHCIKCGEKIEYKWGEYSFRYYEKKDKSDMASMCKACASELKNTDPQVRVISRSPIMELISLKNSAWKTQKYKWSAGSKISTDDKEEA